MPYYLFHIILLFEIFSRYLFRDLDLVMGIDALLVVSTTLEWILNNFYEN